MEGKFGLWAPKHFNDSTTFELNSYRYKHDQCNNVTSGLDNYWNKNSKTHATNTTNGIVKANRRIARTSGPRVRPIIVRLVVERI